MSDYLFYTSSFYTICVSMYKISKQTGAHFHTNNKNQMQSFLTTRT